MCGQEEPLLKVCKCKDPEARAGLPLWGQQVSEAMVVVETGGLGIVQDPRDHCKYFVFYLSETIWATEGFKQRSDVVWLIF